jgi:hypothetical protein
LCDRLVELRVNVGRIFVLVLQDEDIAELREDTSALGGPVADAERALYVEGRAGQPLGFLITALLN